MSRKVDIGFLSANFIGAIIYLVAASYSWALPQERGLNPTTDEPFVWALCVLPIWTVFLLLNLAWAALIFGRKQWRSGRFWLITICIWLVSVAVDFAHH